MENNNVTQDAVKLVSKILEFWLPNKPWDIVNIAIHDKETFYIEEIPHQLFGYKCENTPILLKQYGIIESETIGWWYIGIIKVSSYLRKALPRNLSLSIDDNIFDIASKKGYIAKDEVVQYYYNVWKEDAGPKIPGQEAILVNEKVLKGFVDRFSNNVQVKAPRGRSYWYEDKQLKFILAMGKTDQFDFSKAKVSRKLFETFWTLWNGNASGKYTANEVVTKYKELFNDTLESGRIGEIVSNVRASIINPKPLIKEKLDWKYDRKTQVWIFRINS